MSMIEIIILKHDFWKWWFYFLGGGAVTTTILILLVIIVKIKRALWITMEARQWVYCKCIQDNLCIDVKNKVCYINVASYLPMTIHDIKFNEKQEQGVRTTFEMLSEKQTFDRLLKDLMTPWPNHNLVVKKYSQAFILNFGF